MRITKKRLVPFLASILVLGIVAGSLAFYNATSTIDNELHTNKYGTKTVEEFTPDQELEPGTQITKKVGVTNTGSYDQVVRISMIEKWWRDADNDGEYDEGEEFISFPSSNGYFNDVSAANEATQAGGTAGLTDGLTAGDHTVIAKELASSGWTFNNGFWYYNDVLTPGHNTGDLLKSLTMADNADMGKYTTTEYWSTVAKDNAELVSAKANYDTVVADSSSTQAQIDAAEAALNTAYQWSTTKPADESKITFIKKDNQLDNTKAGYAGAEYMLSVITEVCQASGDAVNATWGLTADPTGTNWNLTY